MNVWIDLETYSPVPIRDGVYRYAEEAEVLLVAWAVGDGPVRVWDVASGDPPPDELKAAVAASESRIWTHTAFDRIVLERAPHAANWEWIRHPAYKWRDVGALAAANGLPVKLARLCEVLRVPEPKVDGGDLVKLFCIPQKDGSRVRREDAPSEWEAFVHYCRQDVVAMRDCALSIHNANYRGGELAVWELDQVINDRGVLIDVPFVREAASLVKREHEASHLRLSGITNGAVSAGTQRDRILKLLSAHGVGLPDLRSSTVERVLSDENLSPLVRSVLAERAFVAQSSVAKYGTILRAVSSDGRLRGALRYCGAPRTGRWSGQLVQLQNLPRTSKSVKSRYDELIDGIRAGVGELLHPDAAEVAGELVRGAIIAPPGSRLAVADLANIEGRVLAWLADETWKLDAFRAYDEGRGPDLYVEAYARAFKVPSETVLRDEAEGGIMRQIGKVMELALGYGGAVGAFSSMASLYGVELANDEVEDIVSRWRDANRRIVSFWFALDRAVRAAIKGGGPVPLGRVKVASVQGAFRIYLPSGRALIYYSPRIDDGGVVSYMGVDTYTRSWKRIDTWYGKLAENVTQAIASDVLRFCIAQAEKAGYRVVLHVHDEVIAETRSGSGEALAKAMISDAPRWAAGLPLAAKGSTMTRYRKA